MRVVEIGINAWEECINLVFLGDLHLGNSGTNELLIRKTAERLRAPNTYWLDLGDSIDAINMKDPRFDPRRLPEWVTLADLGDLTRAQVKRYEHYFGNLGETCLARLFGNHEAALQRHTERDVYQDLSEAINLAPERNLGYSGFIRLRFRKVNRRNKIENTWTQVIYISHGFGGGKLAGSKATNLERLPMAFEADIYAIGHTHTKMALRKRTLGLSPKSNEVIDKDMIMINVGAYLDGRSGYPEQKGLYPQALGPVELRFTPKFKEVTIIQ